MDICITPINKDAEENGSWGEYMGVGLLIARGNNTNFRRSFRRLTKPHKREIDKGTLSDSESESILCQALAESILVGWKNLKVGGKNIEYSVANAKSLLLNDSDCRDYVQNFADDLDNFIKQDEEEVKGE
jgi:hypothetical protein